RIFRYTMQVREDSLQWLHHTKRRYSDSLPDSLTFVGLNLPNQILSLNKAIQQNNLILTKLFANQLLNHPPDSDWFDIYEDAVLKLAFCGEIELAENFLGMIRSLDLRQRYFERLLELQEWVNFCSYYI
ncbi:MAG: hypothetical protein WD022_12040, partial [Balneolaceae bacterium]